MACTDRSNYANLGSTVYVNTPYDLNKADSIGKYDIILTADKMVITNEAYGKYTNIEFTLDSTKKYYPVFNFYSSVTYLPYRVVLNSCFSRCGTCDDWNFKECLTCKADPNNLPAPSC